MVYENFCESKECQDYRLYINWIAYLSDFLQLHLEHLKTKEMKFKLATYYDLSFWSMKALKHLLQSVFILA